jgi:hypothetical protein
MKSHRSYAAVMVVALAVSTEDRLAGNAAATESRVPVCMEKSGYVHATAVNQAQNMAAGIFASIGIAIEWRDLYRRCRAGQDEPILVHLSTHTDYQEFPGALAYALPEGNHIRVFYDRVVQADRGRLSYVLAYTLVHEITHVLQGSNYHSDSGFMKRRWDVKDYEAMEGRTLLFEERDVRLIQLGLKARA